jgi:DNA invertase Pin-like site-specific DNA recombinase
MAPKTNKKVVIYIRTSSVYNARADGDSHRRQEDAGKRHAAQNGMKVARVFSDPGVSGADHIHTRGGFKKMLDYCEKVGISTIIVEDRAITNRKWQNTETKPQYTNKLRRKL